MVIGYLFEEFLVRGLLIKNWGSEPVNEVYGSGEGLGPIGQRYIGS